MKSLPHTHTLHKRKKLAFLYSALNMTCPHLSTVSRFYLKINGGFFPMLKHLGRKPNGRHIWQIGAKYLLQFFFFIPPSAPQAAEIFFFAVLYR